VRLRAVASEMGRSYDIQLRYQGKIFGAGDVKYLEQTSFRLQRRISSAFRTIATYLNAFGEQYKWLLLNKRERPRLGKAVIRFG